jgi:hypothetical protein
VLIHVETQAVELALADDVCDRLAAPAPHEQLPEAVELVRGQRASRVDDHPHPIEPGGMAQQQLGVEAWTVVHAAARQILGGPAQDARDRPDLTRAGGRRGRHERDLVWSSGTSRARASPGWASDWGTGLSVGQITASGHAFGSPTEYQRPGL